LVYGVVSLVTSLFDREILQRFGGDIQQGFFGLAYQVGQICFLFSGTMTPLLTRELAVAHGQEDRERLASLFRRFVPALYAVAAVLSCFACVESRNLAELLGGSKFEGAAPAVAIMALYPIHQTYGQLAGSVFLATDRTKLFSRVTMAGAALSLVPSYLLIAPPSAFGLGLGSVGLALKTVGAQFLTINVLLWFNARFLGQSYLRYLAHQLAAIAVFLGCAYGAMTVVSTGLPAVGSTGLLLHLIATAVLYGVAVLLLIAVCPTLLGLSRGELKAALRSLAGKSLTGS
jgi:O-antigen/teichoic acid export membrane protein